MRKVHIFLFVIVLLLEFALLPLYAYCTLSGWIILILALCFPVAVITGNLVVFFVISVSTEIIINRIKKGRNRIIAIGLRDILVVLIHSALACLFIDESFIGAFQIGFGLSLPLLGCLLLKFIIFDVIMNQSYLDDTKRWKTSF